MTVSKIVQPDPPQCRGRNRPIERLADAAGIPGRSIGACELQAVVPPDGDLSVSTLKEGWRLPGRSGVGRGADQGSRA